MHACLSAVALCTLALQGLRIMCSRVQHLIGATVAWLRGGGPLATLWTAASLVQDQPQVSLHGGTAHGNEGPPRAEQLET